MVKIVVKMVKILKNMIWQGNWIQLSRKETQVEEYQSNHGQGNFSRTHKHQITFTERQLSTDKVRIIQAPSGITKPSH